MLASPKCPCPNLGTGEYVTLHGNRDFTDEITLQILRYGYVPGLSSGPHDCRGPFKREAGELAIERRCDDGTRGCNDVGPPARKCMQPLETRKSVLFKPLGRMLPCQHLDFRPVELISKTIKQ